MVQDELVEQETSDLFFRYQLSDGVWKEGEIIWEYVDSQTGNSYMLYGKDKQSECFEVNVSRYVRDNDKVVFLPQETQRDRWAVRIIYDWVRMILNE